MKNSPFSPLVERIKDARNLFAMHCIQFVQFFTCRKMNYPDSAVCGVDMLTSSSTRPLSVYPEILRVYCERDLTRTHTNTTN